MHSTPILCNGHNTNPKFEPPHNLHSAKDKPVPLPYPTNISTNPTNNNPPLLPDRMYPALPPLSSTIMEADFAIRSLDGSSSKQKSSPACSSFAHNNLPMDKGKTTLLTPETTSAHTNIPSSSLHNPFAPLQNLDEEVVLPSQPPPLSFQ